MRFFASRRLFPRGIVLALGFAALLVVSCQAQAASSGVIVPISAVHGYPGHGTAVFKTGPGTNQYTVTVTMAGLSPGDHPEHIHQGVCPNPGKIAVPLTTLHAGSDGNASATTTVNGALSSVTDGQHSVNVHQADLTQIACGTIPKS